MNEDEMATINSEMRYISLELMKISSKENRNFEDVAKEFVSNVYKLENIIRGRSPVGLRKLRKRRSLRKKGNQLGEL